MNTPLISIIVPIYNAEKYLHKCVDSILAQTYTNIEVILVDDGSTDGCPVICDEYAAQDHRVVVIHQKNSRVCAARNAGLDRAKGDYIGFVDDDDWIEPDTFEVLYEVIRHSGADIAASYDCIGDYKPAKVKATEYVIFSPEEAMTKLLNNQCEMTAVWAKLFTKKIIEKIRFCTEITIGEDVLFMAMAISKRPKISYIKYQSYHYMVRPDSESHAFSERTLTIFNAIDRIIDILWRFNKRLAKYAENHIVLMDIYIAKQFAQRGSLSKNAYRKIVVHIWKYRSWASWNLLSFNKKCNLCLLLIGRTPFIAGRKLLQVFVNVKRKLR